MTAKQSLLFLLSLLAAALVAVAIVLEWPLVELTGLPAKAGTTSATPAKAGTTSATPAEAGTPARRPAKAGIPASTADVGIAAQRARLALNDGRTATFAFAASTGTLTAHAAVGLDQECNYALLPLSDPLPPVPMPSPGPAPQPNPPQPRPRTSNLRVLFTYDPASLADLPPTQQAILASPKLRAYLEKHCPAESDCTGGNCPLNAAHSASYRFLPGTADVSALPAVWQGIFQAARRKPEPWLLVVNEAGQTVVDQAWPDSVEQTLELLEKFGGK